MEYANPALLPDTCINPHLLSFDTSFARQDGSFVPEEGNQYGGSQHSTSLVITPETMTCLKDDEDFVRSNGTAHRRRLVVLWNIVGRGGGLDSDDLVFRTWLKLLEGGTDDDVWLWVDGDEVKIRDQDVSCELEPTECQWREAASALSRRLKRTRDGQGESVQLTERWRRVQEADSDTRFCMIVWLVISSEAMRATDACWGLSRRDVWNLRGMILVWLWSTEEHSKAISDSDDVFKTFCDAMEADGHTCHRDVEYRIKALKKWISMRSLLDPTQRYDVVYLSSWTNTCLPCAARAQSLISINVLDVHHYRPPHHLVLLWKLWTFSDGYSHPRWLTFLEQMAAQNSSPLLKASTLEWVDSVLSKLPPETSIKRFLPWVNFYPEPWRSECTFLSYRDWERVEASIRLAATTEIHHAAERSLSGIHDLPTPVNMQAWIGAMLLSIENSTRPLEDAETIICRVDEYMSSSSFRSIPTFPEVEPTTTAKRSYCKGCRVSPDWYVSAVALTTGTVRAKFTLSVRDVCVKINKFYYRLVSGKNQSSSSKRQRKLSSIVQELAEIMAQEGLRLELPTGNSRFVGSSSPMEGHSAEPAVVGPNRDMGTFNDIHSSKRIHNQRQSSLAETPLNSETTKSAGRVGPPRRSKGFMVNEIKVYLFKLLEDLRVPIPGLKTKHLPWTTLRTLLAERGWELDNWPNGVPLPGSGDRACDDNKGINGLDMKHLHLLYDAMKSKTCPLGFRRIVDSATSATTGGALISDGSAAASGAIVPNEVVHIRESGASRKRTRDTHDAGNNESHPEKRSRGQ